MGIFDKLFGRKRDLTQSKGERDQDEVGALIQALKDKSVDVRMNAADALGKIGDTRAVEPLIVALEDKDDGVCWAAAAALGNIKDTRAVEPLIKALVDKNNLMAASVLGSIGDTRAVKPLKNAIEGHSNLAVREAAALALDMIGARYR